MKAVAFDLDDTLAVTTTARKHLLDEATRRAGSRDITRREYQEAHRDHSGQSTRRPIFEALVEEDADEITQAYRTVIADALEPVEDATATLEILGREYRLGLLTDGPVETQHHKLRQLEWTELFDAVVVTGEMDAPKPDRRAFDRLCDALAATPAETVYVGDDPTRDIEGAVAAGLHAIQVTYDDGPAPHPSATATIPRSDLLRLPDVLDRLDDRAERR